jgi:hypothetical protein
MAGEYFEKKRNKKIFHIASSPELHFVVAVYNVGFKILQ